MDFNYLVDFDPLHEEEKLENIWDEIPVENIEPEPLDDISLINLLLLKVSKKRKKPNFLKTRQRIIIILCSNKLKKFFNSKVTQTFIRMLQLSQQIVI